MRLAWFRRLSAFSMLFLFIFFLFIVAVFATVKFSLSQQEVRSRAAMTSQDAVTISPGASIQAAINANPAGTVFNLPAGTWVNQVFTPKPGNKFFGAPGGGTILTGTNTTSYIYSSDGTVKLDVLMKDITIEHYKVPVSGPALDSGVCGGAAIHGAAGWTFQNMTFRLNNCVGLNAGPDSHVIGGKYIDNGHAGIMGYKSSRTIIEGAEIARNNTRHDDPEWDAAGLKFAVSDGLILRNNYVHDNYGPGLWCDISCSNNLIEGNTVTGNFAVGIFYEISGGTTIIRNNVSNDNGVTKNGRAQIFVSSSSGVEVYGNNVKASGVAAGITMQADPNRTPGISNDSFHNNTVTLTGTSNWYGFTNFGGIVGSGNSSNNNSFYLVNSANSHFYWKSSSAKSFALYRSASGQDVNSTIQVGNASVPGNTQGCPALTGCTGATNTTANSVAITAPSPSASMLPNAVNKNTYLVIDVLLDGIGKGGDRSNPLAGGNPNPKRLERRAEVELFNDKNQLVITKSTTLKFDSNKGMFAGTVDLGTGIATGAYKVKIKTDHYLKALIPGIQTINMALVNKLPLASLVAGDINGDNQLSILDHNVLMNCYSDLLAPVSCDENSAALADLTDDGFVNQIDYNLFMRELSSSLGE